MSFPSVSACLLAIWPWALGISFAALSFSPITFPSISFWDGEVWQGWGARSLGWSGNELKYWPYEDRIPFIFTCSKSDYLSSGPLQIITEHGVSVYAIQVICCIVDFSAQFFYTFWVVLFSYNVRSYGIRKMVRTILFGYNWDHFHHRSSFSSHLLPLRSSYLLIGNLNMGSVGQVKVISLYKLLPIRLIIFTALKFGYGLIRCNDGHLQLCGLFAPLFLQGHLYWLLSFFL